MNEINKQPSRKELQQFGFVMAGFIAVIFGLLLPWLGVWSFSVIPWIPVAGFAGMAAVAPQYLNRVYHLWMLFGGVMQKVMNTLILGTVFYVLVTPFGIIRRMLKIDSLNRHLESSQSSYRINSDNHKSNMRNPY